MQWGGAPRSNHAVVAVTLHTTLSIPRLVPTTTRLRRREHAEAEQEQDEPPARRHQGQRAKQGQERGEEEDQRSGIGGDICGQRPRRRPLLLRTPRQSSKLRQE